MDKYEKLCAIQSYIIKEKIKEIPASGSEESTIVVGKKFRRTDSTSETGRTYDASRTIVNSFAGTGSTYDDSRTSTSHVDQQKINSKGGSDAHAKGLIYIL